MLAGATLRNTALAVFSAAALLVIAIMLGSCAAASLQATVPDLAGMPPGQAAQTLRAARLQPGTASYARSSLVTSGAVAGQSPAPSARAAAQTQVDVVVGVGFGDVPIPDVRLAGAPDAETLLHGIGVVPRVVGAYSPDVPPGRVLEQLPRAGAFARGGDSVVLVVSLGPGTGGKLVPRVTGRSVQAAYGVLERAALSADVRLVDSERVPEGSVVDQVPSAGTRVGVSSPVVLAVAARQ